MKEEKIDRCPGCGHHCPLTAPRCKFGRQYQEKIGMLAHEKGEKGKTCKWEAYVGQNGLGWNLLMQAKRIKNGLRSQKISEEKIFQNLSPQEQQTLLQLLKRLQTE